MKHSVEEDDTREVDTREVDTGEVDTGECLGSAELGRSRTSGETLVEALGLRGSVCHL